MKVVKLTMNGKRVWGLRDKDNTAPERESFYRTREEARDAAREMKETK